MVIPFLPDSSIVLTRASQSACVVAAASGAPLVTAKGGEPAAASALARSRSWWNSTEPRSAVSTTVVSVAPLWRLWQTRLRAPCSGSSSKW